MRLLVHPMLSNIVSNDVENCTTIDLVVAFWCYSASEQIFSGIQNIYLSLVSWMEIPQVNLFELFHSFYSQHHHNVLQVDLLHYLHLCRCRRPDHISSEPELQL